MKYEHPSMEIMQLELRGVICQSPEFGDNDPVDDEDGGFA